MVLTYPGGEDGPVHEGEVPTRAGIDFDPDFDFDFDNDRTDRATVPQSEPQMDTDGHRSEK